MPKINLNDLKVTFGTGYPPPYDGPCLTRVKTSPGDFAGLTQFGAHIVSLPPGAWSSQRHWHSAEDEFVVILKGHPTLVDNSGSQTLSPGEMTAHKAGDPNGHHLKNETDEVIEFLMVGGRSPEMDHVQYPDIDLELPANGTPNRHFRHKDGTDY